MQKYDIVIAGGGMTGLATALILAESNFNICILEKSESEPVFDKDNYNHRVSALNESSENMLKRLGAWDLISSMRISPYYNMHVWDGQSTGKITFSAAEAGVANLGHIIENDVTVLGLLSQLSKHSNIDLQRGKSIQTMGVENGKRKIVLNDGTELQASLVIGCDGANSAIRASSGIDMFTWDYGHTGIVASIRTQENHDFTANQIFGKEKILAFLPLNEPNLISIVYSVPHAQAQEIMQMTDEVFCQHLTQAFEGKLGKVIEASKRHSFAFRQRNVKEYAKEGLVLVGDAAHTIHPLAGQGVNQGFLDVIILAEELLKAAQKGEDIGDIRVLKRYEMRRLPDNLLMMSSMEMFKRGFNSDSSILSWMRNKALDFTDSQSFLKKLVIGQAAGEQRINNIFLGKIVDFWSKF